jgi:hypothetical protein
MDSSFSRKLEQGCKHSYKRHTYSTCPATLIYLYCVLIIFQSDEDKTNFLKIIDALKRSKRGKALGVFSKDNYPGPFMDAWRAALKKEHFETVSFIFIMDQTYMLLM